MTIKTQICITALLALGLHSANADVIFQDDFEDADTAGWALVGNITTSGTQAIGNYSLRMKKTGTATYNLDTSGYSAVTASMQLAATALEAAEYCDAEVSTDGGAQWTSLVSLTNGQDDATFYLGSHSDSALDDNSNVQLRFRNTSNALGDYCWGDEVLVTGTLGGLTPEPEIDAVSSLSFGTVLVGNNSTQTVTISNTGDADLILGNISSVSAPFALSQDNCSNQTLIASASCQLDITYTPTTTTYSSDSISVPSNDADENPLSISVSGTGSTQSSSGNFDPLTGDGNFARSELTFSFLSTGNDPGSLVNMSAYGVPANAAQPVNTFEGRLTLNGA